MSDRYETSNAVHARLMSREFQPTTAPVQQVAQHDYNDPQQLLFLLSKLPDMRFNELEDLLERICSCHCALLTNILLLGSVGRRLDIAMQERSALPSTPLSEDHSFEHLARDSNFDLNPTAPKSARWKSGW